MLTRLAVLAATFVGVTLGAVPGVAGLAGATDPVGPRAEVETAYAELPTGAPTTLPWWQDGALHLGDTVLRTQRSDIVSRNDTTVIAPDIVRRQGQDARWSLVDRGRLRPLPMRTPTSTPLISADGRWIAWKEVRAPRTETYRRIERYRVVLYDVARHRITNLVRDRRLVAWEDGINGIWLRTLSNQGRLVFHRGSDGVQVLSRHGRPVRFGGPQVGNGVQPDGWPRGTTVFRSGSDSSVYGHLQRNGSFERVGRLTVPFSGRWSADGGYYAYTDYDTDSPTFWIRPLQGATIELDAPDDLPYLRLVGWESPHDVILWSYDEDGDDRASSLVRCTVDDGSCERVPGGPTATTTATM